jgi:hypothetical protein
MLSSETTPPRDELLPVELLKYLPDYRVVICASCQYAIQPSAISRHLKEIHDIYRERRRPYLQYTSRLRLDKPETVIESKILDFPVPLLPVQNGLQCQSAGCAHLCVSTNRMRSHWIAVHGRPAGAALDWRAVPLQTFFRGNLLRYFTGVPRSKWSIGCTGEISPVSLDDDDDGEVPEIADLSFVDETQICNTLSNGDLVLLQHYIDFTSLTLATPETMALWQTVVPTMANDHSFLLHGILAISALHLAYLNHTQVTQNTVVAHHHQSLAMPLFRAAITTVSNKSCHAILAFSHLLVLYSFASEKYDSRLLLVSGPEEEGEGPDVLPAWLYFLRNGCAMMCGTWDTIRAGPVEPLASAWEIPINLSAEDDVQKADLLEYFLTLMPLPVSPDAWPEVVCKLYIDAAIGLAWAFSCTRAIGKSFTTWDALRIWPMRLSVAFLDLMGRRHPAALILLAHYCLLLKKVEVHWYFEGRANGLLDKVLQKLDHKWHGCLKWPIKEIMVTSQFD